MEHATVIRLGAIGDAVWTLPVIRELHKDGYEIFVHCKEIASPVYKCNPYIKKLFVYTNKSNIKVSIPVPHGSRLIDLDGEIEGKLLVNGPYGCLIHASKFNSDCVNCLYNKTTRNTELENINYVEQTLKFAGLEGRNPSTLDQILISQQDVDEVKDIIDSWDNKFVILWSLANTYHKQYPYWFELINEFCENNPDALVYTMGSPDCSIYEVESGQIKAGHWTLRQSITLIAHADLIIGGETGPMNIASCFNIKKLLFLSHSSVNNLSKHWTNTTVVTPFSQCYPCHQLHYMVDSCPTRKIVVSQPLLNRKFPVCTIDYLKTNLLSILKWIKNETKREGD